MSDCPCGSGLSFESCCGPHIAGETLPATAEALMRSRYTAYTRQDVDYVCDGRAPEERANVNRPMIAKWAAEADFLGLDIHRIERGGPEDQEGEIEFSVRFQLEGRRLVHRELSTFRRIDGRWYYVNGRILPPAGAEPVRLAAKAGRNDPCPCGSGKKYKKCCAAA